MSQYIFRSILISIPKKPNQCNPNIGTPDMISNYFEGINNAVSQMGVPLLKDRIGVYGSSETVRMLLKKRQVTYAWQQVFHCGDGEDLDREAQLKQYYIQANQTGWLIGCDDKYDPDPKKKNDPNNRHCEAGGLDLDIATKEGLQSMWSRPEKDKKH